MTILEKLGLSRETVAKQLGVKHVEPVRKPSLLSRDQTRKAYSKRACNRVYELHLKGNTAKQISETTGIPEGTVWHICKRAGKHDKRDNKSCHQ